MQRDGVQWLRSRTARRIVVGIAAIIAVIVVAVIVFESSSAVDTIPTVDPAAPQSAGFYTAAGVQITNGTHVPAAGFAPIEVRDADTDVTRIKCSLDGVYLGSDNAAPFAFGAAAPVPGGHTLRCTLKNDATKSDAVTVDFTVDAGSAPSSSTPFGQAASTDPTVSTAPVSSNIQSSQPVPADDQVVVTDAASLQKVLIGAHPGMTITLRDGNYNGKDVRDPSGKEPGRFVAAASGTAAAPIILQGSPQAILDGGGTGGGYALHLVGANYWRLQGFTVQSASKGIVLDRSNHTVIDGVHVTNIGAEGIHFRSFSSDNLLTNSTVDNTGIDAPNFGEGVYIGSAQSNWGTYTDGQPDESDRNQIIDNTLTDTAAENIDIKEGSSGGIIRGNYLGGDRIASKNSADSWMDVKGNGYLVDGNHGVTTVRRDATECGDPNGDPNSTKNPFCQGFEVHVILNGWGRNNTFTGNVLEVNAPGAGIWLQNTAVGQRNLIKCDNKVTGAGAGAYATNHYSPLPCTP